MSRFASTSSIRKMLNMEQEMSNKHAKNENLK